MYECFVQHDEAHAEKLAMRPEHRAFSTVPAGGSLGFDASSRRLLIISSREGLRVKNGNTSPIVALFLEENEEDAWRCFKSGVTGKWAHDWWKFTKATLDAIGSDHPFFRIDAKSPPKCGKPRKK